MKADYEARLSVFEKYSVVFPPVCVLYTIPALMFLCIYSSFVQHHCTVFVTSASSDAALRCMYIIGMELMKRRKKQRKAEKRPRFKRTFGVTKFFLSSCIRVTIYLHSAFASLCLPIALLYLPVQALSEIEELKKEVDVLKSALSETELR